MDTKTRTVVVVGVGALGSEVVRLLRNEKIALRVIDFDHVEAKNTMSQFFGKPSLNKNKANALKELMQFLWGLKIEAIPHKLTAENVEQLLGGAHLVIDCLDNGPSRKLIQDFVRAKGIACVHGALAAGGNYGRVVWDESFVIDQDPATPQPTCEDGEHVAYICGVSSYIARSVHRFLKDGKKFGWDVPGFGGSQRD